MVKKLATHVRAKARGKTRRKTEPEITGQEEQILRKATIHLIRKHGGLFVATGIRQEPGAVPRTWVITVTLRYPTGHEGYVGDLRYDGHTFTFLTEQSLIDERVQQIASDPDGIRLWNEYRASKLPDYGPPRALKDAFPLSKCKTKFSTRVSRPSSTVFRGLMSFPIR